MPGETRKINHTAYLSPWNARNDVVLQFGDPLLFDEVDSVCIFHN